MTASNPDNWNDPPIMIKMPHSTSTTTERRSPSSTTSRPMLPPIISGVSLKTSSQEQSPAYQGGQDALSPQSWRSPIPSSYPNAGANLSMDGWKPRRESFAYRPSDARAAGGGARHERQKSLSDAFHNIRTRRGSMSANAQELADALKAPVSPKLIVLCIIWYLTSALTNTSSKSILNAFPKPVTLTLIQFAFVSSWCIFFSHLAQRYPFLRTHVPALQHGIRAPSRDVIMTTLPLAAFQIGGHLLSSTATSKIPVSLVHTIKGLSPLFTVLAYRFYFRIHYNITTYLSLIPLTLGVMLACSASFSGNIFGILCAFGGAIIFVTQNIFSKKLFNEAASASSSSKARQKLDKLNLLCYSSLLAFLLTAPLWLYSEGLPLLFPPSTPLTLKPKHPLTPSRLTTEFIFNGTFHFLQNIMAFVLLSLVSPVTYSVASLVKRIFVIVVSIVWFGNATTPLQAVGIGLTFLGLYLYDRTSDASRADRRAKLDQLRGSEPLLPLTTGHQALLRSSLDTSGVGGGAPVVFSDSPASATSGQFHGQSSIPNGYGYNTTTSNSFPGMHADEKMDAGAGGTRPRGASNATHALGNGAGWLPPGTRQEETWRNGEKNGNGNGNGFAREGGEEGEAGGVKQS